MKTEAKKLVRTASQWYATEGIAKLEAHIVSVLGTVEGNISASVLQRLLWPDAEPKEVNIVSRAMYNVRKVPSFAPYWTHGAELHIMPKQADGTRRKSIVYKGQKIT